MTTGVTTGKSMQRDVWDDLIEAIVRQAAQDYAMHLRKAKRERLRSGKVPGWVMSNIWSDEHFMRSAWFRELTELDGEYLINRIRRAVYDGDPPGRMG